MAGRRRYGTFTPRRKQALRKAQLVSARRRKGHGRAVLQRGGNRGLSRKAKFGITAGVGTGLVLGGAIVAHKTGYLNVKRVKANNDPKIHTVYEGPLQFNSSGIRVGGGTRTHLVPFQDPKHLHISRAGIRIRPVTGKQGIAVVFGKKTPSGVAPPQAKRHSVDSDAIPHYKGGNWPPGTSPKTARRNAQGLREGTHYLSPKGVKPYPQDEAARKEINEKIFRRSIGLGFTKVGETDNLWTDALASHKRRNRNGRRKKAVKKRKR